jgi:large conductance mechanosensitive channel
MAVWNNPPVAGAEKRATGLLNEFKTFILRGNVVDLAVGIIIGASFSSLVQALVKDIITPLIPTPSTSGLSTFAPTIPVLGTKLLVGDFINTIISFLILALVVFFFVVKPVNALTALAKPKETSAAPTTRECPFCLSDVPIKATRCAYCTSQLPPAEVPVPTSTAKA